MADFIMVKPNVDKPAKPVVTLAMAPQSAKVKASWPECVGAVKYIVYEGASTGTYTKITVIDASAGLTEYISEDYLDGAVVYIAVKAIGFNGVASDISVEKNITVDAYSIAAVSVNITAPVASEDAAVATVAADADYTVKTTAWEDSGGSQLAIGSPFVAETKYGVTVVLEAKEGHIFSDTVSMSATAPFQFHGAPSLNSEKTELTFSGGYLALPIEEVTFALTAPVAGVGADEATVDEGVNYTVKSTAWEDALGEPLALASPFEASTVYHATVVLKAKPDKRILPTIAAADITIPVGATHVSHVVDEDYEENELSITISFPST